jgi:hypothetical protein
VAITELFPLVNPVGSALVFAELIGEEPSRFYHWLASQVALVTVVFLLATEYLGSVLLRFFGLTLPIVHGYRFPRCMLEDSMLVGKAQGDVFSRFPIARAMTGGNIEGMRYTRYGSDRCRKCAEGPI